MSHASLREDTPRRGQSDNQFTDFIVIRKAYHAATEGAACDLGGSLFLSKSHIGALP